MNTRFTIQDADGLDIALADSPAQVHDFARAYGGVARYLDGNTVQIHTR